jgi:thermitase
MFAGFRRTKALRYSRLIFVVLLLPLSSWLTFYTGPYDSHAASQPPVVTSLAAQEQLPQATDGSPDVIRGLLLELPILGLGLWVIRTEDGQLRTVLVLDLKVLEDGLLAPASWVYVDALINLAGLTIATNIRLDDYEPGEVVARLADGVDPTTIAVRHGVFVESALVTSGNIYLFKSLNPSVDTEALVAQVQADSDVLWAELNYIGSVPEGNPYKTWGWGGIEPSGYVNQAAFSQVNLAPAMEHYKGDGMIIALLDTGIDLNHPMLAGRWIEGYDMVADDAIPQDEGPGIGWGHGTHIAGILTHIAPNSKIMPLRVLDADGRGNVFALAYAIEWALDHGADVINLSLGTDEDTNVLREVLARAAAEGVVVVAAAGNNNSEIAQYPVAYDSVIGVTAVTSDNVKADFANYGPWVELAAPGVGITSTIIGEQGSGYASWSGTSMATAFVSGAATLTRQKFPDADPAAIMQVLTTHARALNPNDPLAGQLGGLVDIGNTVITEEEVPGDPTPSPTVTPSPVATVSTTPPSGTVIPPTATPTPTGQSPTATPTAPTPAGPTPTGPTPAVTITTSPTATVTPSPTATPTTGPVVGGPSWRIFLPLVKQ